MPPNRRSPSPEATPTRPPAPVVAVLLAAGGGRRLGGRPKALLPQHGRPLVEHAVRVLRAGGCDPAVRVVLGADAATVRTRAELTGCVLLDNPDWEQGMGSSLRVGLDALRDSDAEAALMFLVDEPGITALAVDRVRRAGSAPDSLAAACYAGRRGHPVLLGARHWDGVRDSATGDRGARSYLRAHAAQLRLVECGDVADPGDIDTPQDLSRLAR